MLADTGGRNDAAQRVGVVDEVLTERLPRPKIELPAMPRISVRLRYRMVTRGPYLPQTGQAPQPLTVTGYFGNGDLLFPGRQVGAAAYFRPPLRSQVL